MSNHENTAPRNAAELAAALGITEDEVAALASEGEAFIAETDAAAACSHRDRTITDHLDYHECLACGAILKRGQ